MTQSLAGYQSGDAVRNSEPRALAVGQPVQVWCRSFGKWVDGFAVVDWSNEGCRVQRSSDGCELPVRFSLDEIAFQRPDSPTGW
jgi:hypothetical protein